MMTTSNEKALFGYLSVALIFALGTGLAINHKLYAVAATLAIIGLYAGILVGACRVAIAIEEKKTP